MSKRSKVFGLSTFPWAAFSGTLIGLMATGVSLSAAQFLFLVGFAVWAVCGTILYFVSERRRMNRPMRYY